MAFIGLQALLRSFPLARFLTEHWPNEPLVVHGKKEKMPELAELPQLQSLDAVLASGPEYILANLPDFNEEYNHVNVGPEAAKKMFGCKMGLAVKPSQSGIPELPLWLYAIRSELGLPAQTNARCLIYAIPRGGKTSCHFDANINLVLQVTGEKRWELAPNEHCVNPVTRHTIGTPLDPVTERYSRKLPFPRSMPKKRQTVVLKRGSFLFVPRGYWHQTSASKDSISLNFTFSQPTWAEVTAELVRNELLKDERWRRAAYGLGSQSRKLREQARSEIAELLKRAPFELPGIDFEKLETLR